MMNLDKLFDELMQEFEEMIEHFKNSWEASASLFL